MTTKPPNFENLDKMAEFLDIQKMPENNKKRKCARITEN